MEYDEGFVLPVHQHRGVVGHIIDAASVLLESVYGSPILFVGFEGHLEAKILDHLHSFGLVEVSLEPHDLPAPTLVGTLQQFHLSDVLPTPHNLLLVLRLHQPRLVHLLAQQPRYPVPIM